MGGHPDLRRDQSPADGVARQVDAVAHPELLEDVRSMAVDGLAADEEHAGDLIARVPLGDELDHLELTWRERIQGGRVAVEVLTHQGGHGSGIEERLRRRGTADRDGPD